MPFMRQRWGAGDATTARRGFIPMGHRIEAVYHASSDPTIIAIS